MKNFSSITENLDITTKKYVDDNKVTSVDGLSGGTLTGDVTVASGYHLKTDLIKSADDSKWIAEITPNGLEIGGNGTPLRFYSNTRLVHATVNKELAYISDIPTFSLSGTTLTITLP